MATVSRRAWSPKISLQIGQKSSAHAAKLARFEWLRHFRMHCAWAIGRFQYSLYVCMRSMVCFWLIPWTSIDNGHQSIFHAWLAVKLFSSSANRTRKTNNKQKYSYFVDVFTCGRKMQLLNVYCERASTVGIVPIALLLSIDCFISVLYVEWRHKENAIFNNPCFGLPIAPRFDRHLGALCTVDSRATICLCMPNINWTKSCDDSIQFHYSK